MGTYLKTLIDAINILIKNVQDNTKQNEKLETEVKMQRKVDEKNRLFLEGLIKTLIANQQVREKNTWATLGKVLDWVLRVGIILLSVAVGVKILA